MMGKYENIDKLLSNIDGTLGFLMSIPWWGWILIVFAMCGGLEYLMDITFIRLPKVIIFDAPKALLRFAEREPGVFFIHMAVQISVLALMVIAAYKAPWTKELIQKHPLIIVGATLFFCFAAWNVIEEFRKPADNQSPK